MLISSVQNPRVKAAARLRERHGRDDQGRIIIDGPREIERALAGDVEVVEIYICGEQSRGDEHERVVTAAVKRGAERFDVTPRVMEKLAFGQRASGVVACSAYSRTRTCTGSWSASGRVCRYRSKLSKRSCSRS